MDRLKGLGWWTAWTLLAGYRLVQVILMLVSGNALGWLLVIPEGAALAFGIVNAFHAKTRDYRLIGLWVPFCYAAGIFLVSGHAIKSTPWALALFIGAEILSVWALACLRTRFSVGAAAWVSLCDWGPYRLIRHPQLAARMLIVVACCLSVGDWIGLAIACAMTVSVVLVEEGHLMGMEDYREYVSRVPYRLVPGVF